METRELTDLTPNAYRCLFNAIPSMVFVVDWDVQIIQWNEAASRAIGRDNEEVLMKRSGEALHCIHSTDVPGGCGRSPACRECVIRNSVNESFRGSSVHRKMTSMTLRTDDGFVDFFALVTTAPFESEGERFSLLIIEDVGELIQLQKLIPICSWCKKVRHDTEYWESVEVYISKHLDLRFSHGICPECMREKYPATYRRTYGDHAGRTAENTPTTS